jgi:hypothetical protein
VPENRLSSWVVTEKQPFSRSSQQLVTEKQVFFISTVSNRKTSSFSRSSQKLVTEKQLFSRSSQKLATEKQLFSRSSQQLVIENSSITITTHGLHLFSCSYLNRLVLLGYPVTVFKVKCLCLITAAEPTLEMLLKYYKKDKVQKMGDCENHTSLSRTSTKQSIVH